MQQELNDKLKLGNTKEIKPLEAIDGYDYSKFTSVNNFSWDEDLAAKFLPIAKKLNLSQESVDILLEIALEMSEKQRAHYEKDIETKYMDDVLLYNKMFSEDNELPDVNSIQMKEFMDIANGAYSEFTSPKLKEMFEKSGLVYHPELIKMFHKIGVLSQEDNLSHYGAPAIEELTPAQILYGTNK